MLKLSPGEVWGAVLVVLLLLGAGLNRLLFLSYRKNNQTPFKDLASYLPVLKEGWLIVHKNMWLFWIILSLRVFNSFQQTLIQYLHFKPGSPDQSFFRLYRSTFRPPPSYITYLTEKFVLSLKSFSFHLDIVWGVMPSIFFLLFIVIMIKLYRRFLSRSFIPELQPSVMFLKRNFWPFAIATTLLLLNFVLFLFFPSFFEETFFGRYYSFFPGYYWNIVAGSLVAGFVLTLFKNRASGNETTKGEIFISSLGHFRALFFFYLMYLLFTLVACGLPISILGYLQCGRFSGVRYLQLGMCVFPIIFLMVPYSIVIENVNWKTGFKHGFLFWKRKFPQTFVLLMVVMFFMWLADFFSLAFISFTFDLLPFHGTSIFLALGIIVIALRSFVTFLITAIVMVFCLKSKEVGLLKK